MDARSRCHACGSHEWSEFYEVGDIPVHSVLLMPTRDAALNYPKGQLRLAYCGDCGFVQNVTFDPDVHEYSPRYEETQGFSPRFNQFARKLAQTWIDRFGLHDKRILEIGSGKGEFLVLLCEMGPNRGIGIDPPGSRADLRRAGRVAQEALRAPGCGRRPDR